MFFLYYTVIFFFTILLSITPESFAASSVTSTAPAPLHYKVRVVKAYPHSRDSFTQGLVYINGSMYEGTGLKGSSYLMKKDVATGKSIKTFKLPDNFFGEGITVIDNRVVQLTWKSKTGFVYDLETFKMIKEFHYPNEGWGLTNDGTNLIMSDGSRTLSFLNPDDFRKVKEVDVRETDGTPVKDINELEFVNGSIYANIWKSDKIAIISPKNGLVTGWIDLTGILAQSLLIYPVDVLNGIAYDNEGGRLFVTGKLWPVLFEVELVEGPETVSYN